MSKRTGNRREFEEWLALASEGQKKRKSWALKQGITVDNKAPMQRTKARRFGFAGFCFLIAVVIFAFQMLYSLIGSPPSWLGAVACLGTIALLLILGIWFWDRSADSYIGIRLTSTVLALLLLFGLGYSPIHREYVSEHVKPKTKPWCYALVFDEWPLNPRDMKVKLVVVNPTTVAAHFVRVSVTEPYHPRQFRGPVERARDLELYSLLGMTVPLVGPDPENQFRWVGTGKDLMILGLSRQVHVFLQPEDGEAVEEDIQFNMNSECIHNVTRVSDKKVLLQEVAPPFDRFGSRTEKQGWQSCQQMIF